MKIPKHAKKELEAYLDCGLLCRGFARLRCGDCNERRLVAFSCKGDFGAGRTVLAIVAGDFFGCAILDGRDVKCCGLNYNGSLGLGDASSRGNVPGTMGDSLLPVALW